MTRSHRKRNRFKRWPELASKNALAQRQQTATSPTRFGGPESVYAACAVQNRAVSSRLGRSNPGRMVFPAWELS